MEKRKHLLQQREDHQSLARRERVTYNEGFQFPRIASKDIKEAWLIIEADLISAMFYPKKRNQPAMFFYKSHMTVTPLVIVNSVTNESKLYLWDKTQGKRVNLPSQMIINAGG